MPDHFHGLLQLHDSKADDLSSIMKFIKGQAARDINKQLNRSGSLWQTGFHDHALRKKEDRVATARYIVANPLRAGLATKLANWPHWDSVWLQVGNEVTAKLIIYSNFGTLSKAHVGLNPNLRY